MIKSVKLTNFFSFQEAEIDLKQEVNILVGINGSGKSNLMKAIKLLKVGVEGNSDDTALRSLFIDQWGGFDSVYCKKIEQSEFRNSIGIEFCFDGAVLSKYGQMNFREDVIYKIVIIKKNAVDNYYVSEEIGLVGEGNYTFLNFIAGKGKVSERQENHTARLVSYEDYNPQELALAKISEFDKDRYLPLVIIKRAIRDIASYEYFNTTSTGKLRRAMSATSSLKKLLPDGGNLPQLLNYIKINHRVSYKKIIDKLKDINSNFLSIDFNILGSGTLEVMLEESDLNSSIHITHVSDGTLRFLCLLAILFNPDRGKFICIDEPEVGLHPDMINTIVHAIKDASEDTTFLIASHSENILDGFNVNDILVVEKDQTNTSEVKRYSEEDFDGWYETFSPGLMWRNGDLGGKRW